MTTEADNVIPVEEMNRRRRVTELASDLADIWRALGGKERELREMGVPTDEWIDLALRSLSSEALAQIGPNTRRVLPILVDVVVRLCGGEQLTAGDYADAVRIGAGIADDGHDHATPSIVQLLIASLPDMIPTIMGAVGASKADGPQVPLEDELTSEGYRMRAVIDRLFADAPKLENPATGKPVDDQAPAVEVHLVLKTGQQLQGVLSTTPEGTLRLATPNQRVDPRTKQPVGAPVLIETFFDYEQVSAVAVVREIAIEAGPASPIITPG